MMESFQQKGNVFSFDKIRHLGNTIIILISGKAGVGKSTVANYMDKILQWESNLDIGRTGFAFELKRIAKEELNWDEKKDDNGRNLLQNLGRTGREYEENLWVKKVEEKIDSAIGLFDVVFIDDWRYPNEEDYLKSLGKYSVYTVNVISDRLGLLNGTKYANDISETSLKGRKFDIVIANNGTLGQLEGYSKTALAYLFQEHIKKLGE